MTIFGILSLFVVLVIAYVLIKFAVKLASLVLMLAILFGVACWLYPPLYEAAKPALLRLVPFLQDGAQEAATTAKAMTETIKNQKEEK